MERGYKEQSYLPLRLSGCLHLLPVCMPAYTLTEGLSFDFKHVKERVDGLLKREQCSPAELVAAVDHLTWHLSALDALVECLLGAPEDAGRLGNAHLPVERADKRGEHLLHSLEPAVEFYFLGERHGATILCNYLILVTQVSTIPLLDTMNSYP